MKTLIKKLYIYVPMLALTVANPAPGLFSTRFGTDFKSIIYGAINILLGIAGTLAILFVIIGGYQYLTSGANPEMAERGKKTLTNAIIGLVIIILSYTVVSIIYKTLS